MAGRSGRRSRFRAADEARQAVSHAFDLHLERADVGAALPKELAHQHEPLQVEDEIVELAKVFHLGSPF